MDILTGKCSDRFMAHVLKRRDQEAVRWYVLTLPTAGGGRDRISPSKGLDAELSRRERRGEALFEYFSPSYVEARKVGGKMVNTRQPLLYNYVFVHASDIFRWTNSRLSRSAALAVRQLSSRRSAAFTTWTRSKPTPTGDEVGKVSLQLYTLLQDIQYGRTEDKHNWCTIVM